VEYGSARVERDCLILTQFLKVSRLPVEAQFSADQSRCTAADDGSALRFDLEGDGDLNPGIRPTKPPQAGRGGF
jgi:hypothetical protein